MISEIIIFLAMWLTTSLCEVSLSEYQKRISRSEGNHRRRRLKFYILRTKYYYLLFQAPPAPMIRLWAADLLLNEGWYNCSVLFSHHSWQFGKILKHAKKPYLNWCLKKGRICSFLTSLHLAGVITPRLDVGRVAIVGGNWQRHFTQWCC